MVVTLGGMVMETRLLHLQNAPPPMVVTLGDMVIDVRLSHQENAWSPTAVTLGGMVQDSAFERKATRIPFSTSTSAPSSYLK